MRNFENRNSNRVCRHNVESLIATIPHNLALIRFFPKKTSFADGLTVSETIARGRRMLVPWQYLWQRSSTDDGDYDQWPHHDNRSVDIVKQT